MADALFLGTIVLQVAILVTLLEGLRRRNFAAVVNALVAFGATLLPFLVAGGLAPSVLPLWIALAGFLHSLGMLGPYDTVAWWDLLTHAVSGTLVAALVYAAALVALAGPPVTAGIVGVTLLVTVAAGAFWELLELVARDLGERYGVDPVLVHYGWRDTAVDLVVDVAGAALVVGLDVRLFVPAAARFPEATRLLLVSASGAVVAGSLAAAVWIRYGVEDPG